LEGRISRGKRKDGKRKYQYILARTREDVIDKMAEIRRNEQPTGKCHKTMDALFNEWFRSVQHLVKESTSANYAMKAEKHILPILVINWLVPLHRMTSMRLFRRSRRQDYPCVMLQISSY